MIWVTLILTLFGPLLGEIIKRILLKLIPGLPKAQRKAAKVELVKILKNAVKKDDKAEHGYSAVKSSADLHGELLAFETKLKDMTA